MLPHLCKQANLSAFMSSPDFMNSWTLPTSSGKDTYQNSMAHEPDARYRGYSQEISGFFGTRTKVNQCEPSHKQETWLTTATVQQLRLRHAEATRCHPPVTLCLAPRHLVMWISRRCAVDRRSCRLFQRTLLPGVTVWYGSCLSPLQS